MKRRNFFKSVLTILVSPKLIEEVCVIQTLNIKIFTGIPIDQSFFDIAFSKQSNNRIYKECYNVDLISANMNSFINEFIECKPIS